MPILGIWASQITGKLSTPDGYQSIATTTVGAGGASSITFSSIPSTYTHLQIRAIIRGTTSAANVDSIIRFNNDSTSGNYYYYHQLFGSGSSATSNTGNTDTTSTLYSFAPADNANANVFGGSVLDILDYSNTNKNKTTRSLHGYDDNGSGFIILRSGLWMQTSAINRIDLTPLLGNFAQYSSFALYGIKGN
jgi:hypothetical protein